MPSNSPALFEAVTTDTSQWKLSNIQVVGWGTFDYASVDLADTTLITGQSGSGKSTLLDAYTAVMMPSSVAFNGASNAGGGRARSASQRNILTYMRGKIDEVRDSDGVTRDKVLRGESSATWSAIAATFKSSVGETFTHLAMYYAPRGASSSADVQRTLASIHSEFDIRQLERAAAQRFQWKAVHAEFPGMIKHDGPGAASTYTWVKLGIGSHGNGSAAMQLLSRIQAGRSVRSVSSLFTDLVLERPATFAAADAAWTHFQTLQASYYDMKTAGEKLQALQGIEALYAQHATAADMVATLESLNVPKKHSPFALWKSRKLLAGAESASHATSLKKAEAAEKYAEAQRHSTGIDQELDRLQNIRSQYRDDALAALKRQLNDSERTHHQAEQRRAEFLDRTAAIGAPQTAEDFAAAAGSASKVLQNAAADLEALDTERLEAHDSLRDHLDRKRELNERLRELERQTGRVPSALIQVRDRIAESCGMTAEDLPFVAELIDVAPDEQHWRTAVEASLHSLALSILVDQAQLPQLRSAINAEKLSRRVTFQGVALGAPKVDPQGPEWISGKLIYNEESQFTGWLTSAVKTKDRICVASPAKLGTSTPAVTAAGQTSDRDRGAHGSFGAHVIGFSNESDKEEIRRELALIEQELQRLTAAERRAITHSEELRDKVAACRVVLATKWSDIDVRTTGAEVQRLQQAVQDHVDTHDELRRIESDICNVQKEKAEADEARYEAKRHLKSTTAAHNEAQTSVQLLQATVNALQNDPNSAVTPDVETNLQEWFAETEPSVSPHDMEAALERFSRALLRKQRDAAERVESSSTQLLRIFAGYNSRWPDPNRGDGLEAYPEFKKILDALEADGLHKWEAQWQQHLSSWNAADLVLLSRSFQEAADSIAERLAPVNKVLAGLAFGAEGTTLQIRKREKQTAQYRAFRRELAQLATVSSDPLSASELDRQFRAVQRFMESLSPEAKGRDRLLDIRQQIDITASAVNSEGKEVATYATLAGKSGGETQELLAFIIGAALRYQLGDQTRSRPRFAPVLLDEGYIKADARFAGRAMKAWRGLGFQILIAAPQGMYTALEPHSDRTIVVQKSSDSRSHLTVLEQADAPSS